MCSNLKRLGVAVLAAGAFAAGPITVQGQTMNEATEAVIISQQVISIPQLRDVPDTVQHVAWNTNGSEFAVVAGLHVLVFNANTKKLVHDLSPLSNGWGSLSPVIAYSPDGRYLAAGKDVISIFDASTGAKIRDIVGPYRGKDRADTASPRANVQSLVFSPDSQFMGVVYNNYWPVSATKGTDVVSAYRVETGQQLFWVAAPVYQSRGLLTTNIVFSHDAQYLIVGRANIADTRIPGQVFQYFTYVDYIDSQTGKFTKSITPIHVMPATALAIDSNGIYIATGTQTLSKEKHRRRGAVDKWDTIDNRDPVRLWDLVSGKLVREFGPINDTVRALAISPDGRFLAVNYSLQVVIFDLAGGRFLQAINLPGSHDSSLSLQLAFSPDSSVLAVPLNTNIYLFGFK